MRGRRTVDRKADAGERNLASVGIAGSASAAALATAAFLRAPVRYAGSPDCPSDGFNGQVQAHRGLSVLWLVVMILCALSLAVPSAKRRPRTIWLLCGLSFGLLVGAVIRVDTWLVGYCFS